MLPRNEFCRLLKLHFRLAQQLCANSMIYAIRQTGRGIPLRQETGDRTSLAENFALFTCGDRLSRLLGASKSMLETYVLEASAAVQETAVHGRNRAGVPPRVSCFGGMPAARLVDDLPNAHSASWKSRWQSQFWPTLCLTRFCNDPSLRQHPDVLANLQRKFGGPKASAKRTDCIFNEVQISSVPLHGCIPASGWMISVVGKEWVVASTHLATQHGRSGEPWSENVVQLTGLAGRQSTLLKRQPLSP